LRRSGDFAGRVRRGRSLASRLRGLRAVLTVAGRLRWSGSITGWVRRSGGFAGRVRWCGSIAGRLGRLGAVLTVASGLRGSRGFAGRVLGLGRLRLGGLVGVLRDVEGGAGGDSVGAVAVGDGGRLRADKGGGADGLDDSLNGLG
jgi:hypothetical protein